MQPPFVILAVADRVSFTIGYGRMHDHVDQGDEVQVVMDGVAVARAWREAGRFQFHGAHTGRHSIRADSGADTFFAQWGRVMSENIAAHRSHPRAA